MVETKLSHKAGFYNGFRVFAYLNHRLGPALLPVVFYSILGFRAEVTLKKTLGIESVVSPMIATRLSKKYGPIRFLGTYQVEAEHPSELVLLGVKLRLQENRMAQTNSPILSAWGRVSFEVNG